MNPNQGETMNINESIRKHVDDILVLLPDDEYDMAASLAHIRRLCLLTEAALPTVEAPGVMPPWIGDQRLWEKIVASDELPDAKPIPGKQYPRVMSDAQGVTCPVCKAKPGHRCFYMSRKGANADITDRVRDVGYHKDRLRKARQAKWAKR